MNPAQLIDQQIADTPDWRGERIAQLRKLVHEADSEITEEWKWGVGVYVHKGMVCAMSAFKDHVKMNFFKGAQLKDPNHLLNSGFTSKQHRALDFNENDKVNASGIKELIKEAVALNK